MDPITYVPPHRREVNNNFDDLAKNNDVDPIYKGNEEKEEERSFDVKPSKKVPSTTRASNTFQKKMFVIQDFKEDSLVSLMGSLVVTLESKNVSSCYICDRPMKFVICRVCGKNYRNSR